MTPNSQISARISKGLELISDRVIEYAYNLGENRAKVDGFSKQLPFHRGFSDVKS